MSCNHCNSHLKRKGWTPCLGSTSDIYVSHRRCMPHMLNTFTLSTSHPVLDTFLGGVTSYLAALCSYKGKRISNNMEINCTKGEQIIFSKLSPSVSLCYLILALCRKRHIHAVAVVFMLPRICHKNWSWKNILLLILYSSPSFSRVYRKERNTWRSP